MEIFQIEFVLFYLNLLLGKYRVKARGQRHLRTVCSVNREEDFAMIFPKKQTHAIEPAAITINQLHTRIRIRTNR